MSKQTINTQNSLNLRVKEGGNVRMTVCVPTYNVDKYIQQCLESILRQTWQDFELLLVDNCSTDDTYRIAQKFLANRPGARLVQNERNLGMAGNMNRCMELAHGEWIKFVFSDDTIEPTCLERMYYYTKFGSPLICCKRNIIYEKSKETEQNKSLIQNINALKQHRDFVDSIYPVSSIVFPESIARLICKTTMMNLIGEPNCLLFHRSISEELGYFDTEFSQYMDWEFISRVATNKGLLIISEYLANFRVHSQSTTQANARRSGEIELVEHFLLHHRYIFHPHYATFRNNCPSDCLQNIRKMVSAVAMHLVNHMDHVDAHPPWKELISSYLIIPERRVLSCKTV